VIGAVPLNKQSAGVPATICTTNKAEVQASGEIKNFKHEVKEDQNNVYNYSDTVR
jgi:hypothetical protein